MQRYLLEGLGYKILLSYASYGIFCITLSELFVIDFW